MRAWLGSVAARTARKMLRLRGKGGTTYPGVLALKFDPKIISKISKNKYIVTITGTNGKTTTSHMISEMFHELGYDVINNISGANLASGVATAMICGKEDMVKAEGKSKGLVYVMEVDEAAFAKIAGDLNPTVSVVTNLFRDQLDRYGELTHTRDLIAGGIDKTNATLVINSDDSLVASLGKGREDRSIFYGMGKEDMLYNNEKYPPKKGILPASPDAVYCPECHVKYEYKARSFGHLGDFKCPSCGFSSPTNRFSVRYDLATSPSNEDYPFAISDDKKNETINLKLKVPGSHNIYNTCAAVSAVTVMLDKMSVKDPDESNLAKAIKAEDKVKAAFGRMEKIQIGDKKLCLLLVKNPVGFDRSLSFVEETNDADSLMLLLNSKSADGKDVSWIWDVDLESKMEGLPKKLYVSGKRYGDMLLRVQYAGGEVEKYGDMTKAMDILKEAIDKCPAGKCVYVMPNYTSMMDLRKKIAQEYNLKEFWK